MFIYSEVEMDSRVKVLVYSDNSDVRESVMRSVGRTVPGTGVAIDWMEGATPMALF